MLDDGFFLYSHIHAHDDDPKSAESCRASLQTLVEGCQKQIHPPQKMLFFFNCVLLLNRSRAHPCTYTHFFLFLFFPPSFLSYIIYLFVHHFRSDFKQSVKHVALHFISVTKSLAQTKKCKTPPLFQKLYGSNVTTTATNATVLLKKSTFFPPIVAFIYLFIYL